MTWITVLAATPGTSTIDARLPTFTVTAARRQHGVWVIEANTEGLGLGQTPIGPTGRAQYLLGADSQGRDKPTIWWNCGLYGKRAESLSQYLTKGQAVTVSGTITEREWVDKEGTKRKSIDVRVGDIALQGGRREAEPARAPAPVQQQIDDGDVPF